MDLLFFVEVYPTVSVGSGSERGENSVEERERSEIPKSPNMGERGTVGCKCRNRGIIIKLINDTLHTHTQVDTERWFMFLTDLNHHLLMCTVSQYTYS